MGRLVKAILVLVIAAFVGVVGYAYLGDMAPAQGTVSKPVVLDGR